MTDIDIRETPTKEELWTLLETDKDKFIATMRLAQADHEMKMRLNPWTIGGGNLMYGMMQTVWTEFHKKELERQRQKQEEANLARIAKARVAQQQRQWQQRVEEEANRRVEQEKFEADVQAKIAEIKTSR